MQADPQRGQRVDAAGGNGRLGVRWLAIVDKTLRAHDLLLLWGRERSGSDLVAGCTS
jgi:hypothetical protein